MKFDLKKLWENRTARILLVALAGVLLLLLCMAAFSPRKESTAEQTPTEARLSAILSEVAGAGSVRAMIAEEDGVPVSAVVLFDGEDGILIRLRLTQVTAASLNIAENRVIVCPSEG